MAHLWSMVCAHLWCMVSNGCLLYPLVVHAPTWTGQQWLPSVPTCGQCSYMDRARLVRFLRTQSGGGLASEQDYPVDPSRGGSLSANPARTRSRPQHAHPREETLGADTSGHQATRGTAKPPRGHRTFATSCVGPQSTQVVPAARSARDLGPSASINYPLATPVATKASSGSQGPLRPSFLPSSNYWGRWSSADFELDTTVWHSSARRLVRFLRTQSGGGLASEQDDPIDPSRWGSLSIGFPLGEPHSDQVQTPASSPRVETLGADTSGHQAPRGMAKPPRGHRTFAPSCVGPQSTQVAPATRSARDLGSSASIDYPLDTPGTTQASSGRHGPLRPIVPIGNWT
ncbi:hypothetical protein ACOMHN_026059 [Nucella lapillus]